MSTKESEARFVVSKGLSLSGINLSFPGSSADSQTHEAESAESAELRALGELVLADSC